MGFFFSKLEGADVNVRLKEKILYKNNIYFVSGV